MKYFKTLLLAVCLPFLMSCGTDGPQLKTNVTGKAGEVVVVTDKVNWENEPGNAIRSILAKYYPYLPQPEPSYNLFNIPENAFTKIFQTHRNLILLKVDSNKYKEAKMITQEDIWASPQTVVTITAPNRESAAKYIESKSDLLFNTIGQAERNRIIRNSKRYEEQSLRRIVADEFGGSPYFPVGYSLKKRVDDFIWISYETTYTNQGIFVYRIPYVDTNSIKLENFIAARNLVLKNNVPGMLENSYMTTANEECNLSWITYKRKQFAEIRGLWEVQNDFMGGPFVSHAFYDKDGKNIIVLEGFVYAPRYDKRNYLRQVESIIYSFEWAEDFNK